MSVIASEHIHKKLRKFMRIRFLDSNDVVTHTAISQTAVKPNINLHEISMK